MIGGVDPRTSDLNKLTPIVFKLIQMFLDYDLTLAEINPLAKLEDGRFIVLDGHIDMEAEARGLHKPLLEELGIGDDEANAPVSWPNNSLSNRVVLKAAQFKHSNTLPRRGLNV